MTARADADSRQAGLAGDLASNRFVVVGFVALQIGEPSRAIGDDVGVPFSTGLDDIGTEILCPFRLALDNEVSRSGVRGADSQPEFTGKAAGIWWRSMPTFAAMWVRIAYDSNFLAGASASSRTKTRRSSFGGAGVGRPWRRRSALCCGAGGGAPAEGLAWPPGVWRGLRPAATLLYVGAVTDGSIDRDWRQKSRKLVANWFAKLCSMPEVNCFAAWSNDSQNAWKTANLAL